MNKQLQYKAPRVQKQKAGAHRRVWIGMYKRGHVQQKDPGGQKPTNNALINFIKLSYLKIYFSFNKFLKNLPRLLFYIICN